MWSMIYKITGKTPPPQQHPLADDTMLWYSISMVDTRVKVIEPRVSQNAAKKRL
jgi:hypothetical protein